MKNPDHFPTKVPLEVLAENSFGTCLTVSSHPNLITNWAQQGMVDTISAKKKNSKKSNENEIKNLHAKR